MNIHTPERGTNETAEQYKNRRAASRDAVRAMTLGGIGDQHRKPGSREQFRASRKKRLNEDGQQRAKNDRARQRAESRG